MPDEISFDHHTYLSPFTWRYGSPAMRQLWSQHHLRTLWRRVWVALADAQASAGLVDAAQVADLRAHQDEVDLIRAQAIEAEIHHDLMAELRTFAEQCPVGGGIIHLGATSADIQDNADALRLRQALQLILEGLRDVLQIAADQIDRWADTVSMGFTHIQPAEPTTIGYRLAQYGQDLLTDWHEVSRVQQGIRGKGIKGAVGTGASYEELLHGTGWSAAQLEARVMSSLELDAFPVSTQISPRKQDWLVVNALAGIAASASKMMFDLRILQSPPIGEWAEPFREKQVGSSAMPFKRNPVNAEKVNSLARWVASLPRLAWDNAALTLLERTLDDSANRRLMLPTAFLAVDEILLSLRRILQDLRVNEEAVSRNLAIYGTFSAVERLLMALGKAGADRQLMHERLRSHSMVAWGAVSTGSVNPLVDSLSADPEITRYIPASQVRALLNAESYVGDAPQRARALAQMIRSAS
ncbi:MAG TPA: adenylosuccinate lyase [Aggregatilineaceae bacterium]|nr:adenylosuccinate lyase [Aggregatilineaceae bacterium]